MEHHLRQLDRGFSWEWGASGSGRGGPLAFLLGSPSRLPPSSGWFQRRQACGRLSSAPRCWGPADAGEGLFVILQLAAALCLQNPVLQVNGERASASSRCLRASGCLSLPRNIWMPRGRLGFDAPLWHGRRPGFGCPGYGKINSLSGVGGHRTRGLRRAPALGKPPPVPR